MGSNADGSIDAAQRDWQEFLALSRVETAKRNQKFLVLGVVLVGLFSLFDVFSDDVSPQELRLRLINNAIVAFTLVALVGVLRTKWGEARVFGLLFTMAAAVLMGQAYLLTEVTNAPGRLAFHYLAVLALTMAGIQWPWTWHLGLGILGVAMLVWAMPASHPDFAFFVVSLSGCVVLSTVFGHALVLMRFRQFQTANRLALLHQESLQRRADLEALNDEMRDFAYALSHDLRAPLINLDGFSKALQDNVDEIDGLVEGSGEGNALADRWEALHEDMSESLDFIGGAAKKMARLIDGILELSRLDRRNAEIGNVDLNSVVDEVLDSLQHQINQREIEIEVGPLPTICSDRLRVSQLFGNLVDNSIKYMAPEGTARISISLDQRDGQSIYRVTDNGIGIRKQDHQRVFRIFSRAGNTKVQGDGIGLSAVKKIVDQHHGAIWIDPERSDLGVGTSICFTLPTPPSTAETNGRPAAPESAR